MKRLHLPVLAVPVLAALMLLVACGSDDTSDSSDSTEAFVGQWELAEGTVDGAPLPTVDGYRITMGLTAEGSIGGTAACNSYGGSYALDGSSLELGELSWTEMGCEPAVMESEQVFLAALQRDVELGRDGADLTMTGEDVQLRFTEIPPVEPAELVGTTWTLDTIISGETASSVQGEPTLFLDADGSMTGSTGCRDLSGTYILEGDSLLFTSLAADGECTPDLERQDNAVVTVLESPRIEIDGKRLTLTAPGDEGLSFRAE